MIKWLKNLLGLAIIVFLGWYLVKHWGELKPLLNLSATKLFLMYFITFLPILNSAYVVKYLLMKTFKTRTSYWNLVLLQNATGLLNYAPRFGTVFNANYLKRHYGLSYTLFGVSFAYITLLLVTTASTIGLIALATVYGVNTYERKILAAVFLGAIILSITLSFMPLPVPKGQGRLSRILRNFLTGRRQIAYNKKVLFVSAGFFLVNFIYASIRLAIIFSSLGQHIHPAGYFVLGAIAYCTIFINLTPGSLGIREVSLLFCAVAIGVPAEAAKFAPIIDRAVALSWTFVIGGTSAIWLWHKSPADFKESQSD